jgi:DNA-binding GntR family transcriptional regulator
VPLSIAALARRFRVSRTHVLRLIRDAESAGLLIRLGEKGELVSFAPQLRQGIRDFFAAIFQLTALCAWGAVAEGH